MPETVEAIKENSAHLAKAMKEDVDSARKVVADKINPEPEPTLFEKVANPVKDTLANAVDYVKKIGT